MNINFTALVYNEKGSFIRLLKSTITRFITAYKRCSKTIFNDSIMIHYERNSTWTFFLDLRRPQEFNLIYNKLMTKKAFDMSNWI